MAKYERVLNKNSYYENIEWLTTVLKEKKLDKQELYTAQLLVEENFMQLLKLAKKGTEQNVTLSVIKTFGAIDVVLSAPGDVYLPFEKFDENCLNENDDDFASLSIINSYKSKITVSRKNDLNVVTIRVHKPSLGQTKIMLLGVFSGLLLGMVLRETVSDPVYLTWIEQNLLNPIQTILLHALVLVSAPLIFFSILSGICNISDTAALGKIGIKLMLISLPKLAFYVALGLAVGHLLGQIDVIAQWVGKDSDLPNQGVSIRDMIVNIVPNDLVTPFYTNNILQMLFMAFVFGILLVKAGPWATWAKDGIAFFTRFFEEVIGWIIPFIPLLAMVSMMKVTLYTGLESVLPFVKIIIAAAVGCLLSILISGMLVVIVGRMSPIPFIRKAFKFIPIPFSLCDSIACIPSTMKFCLTKLGMEEKFTKFCVPVGMQLNMDGTAYYVAIVSIMLAKGAGLDINFEFIASFFFALFLISLTGLGIIAMPSIYAAFGIPQFAVALMIGIEPILDMFGTVQNVTGNITTSFLVARKANAVEKGIYQSTKESQ